MDRESIKSPKNLTTVVTFGSHPLLKIAFSLRGAPHEQIKMRLSPVAQSTKYQIRKKSKS